jgi:hypothetical protein
LIEQPALFDSDYMKALFAHGRIVGRSQAAFEPIGHAAPAAEPTSFRSVAAVWM